MDRRILLGLVGQPCEAALDPDAWLASLANITAAMTGDHGLITTISSCCALTPRTTDDRETFMRLTCGNPKSFNTPHGRAGSRMR
jgi:hypothetical protein